MTAAADTLGFGQPTTAARAIPWERLRLLPLALTLATQTFLTVRLVNHIPSSDEGRYIYAGHQIVYELFHGGGSPYYETYFSGAPDIYPPIAAAADHLGGIVAVRLMSCVFMLAATTLLYATGSRLFGYWAGVASAALFGMIGLTHSIGVYANYDAMALMLLAGAAYCAARASQDSSGGWLISVPLVLLAANATKYPSLLFDPSVIAITASRLRGWRVIVGRMMILGSATGALLCLAAALAGTAYLKGIMFTTLNRSKGDNAILGATYTTTRHVIDESCGWIGIAIVLAVVAVLLPRRTDMPRWFLAVMALSGALVTLEAIHLHSDESMGQHDDFSAFFACIVAGYVLTYVSRLTRQSAVHWMTGIIACSVIGGTGVYYWVTAHVIDRASGVQITHSLEMDAIGLPYISKPGARLLISGGFAQMIYTDQVNVHWWNLADDNYIKYPIPGRGGDAHGVRPGRVCQRVLPGCMYLEGPQAYASAIRAHWFAFVSLYGRGQAIPQDGIIKYAVEHARGYVMLTRLGNAPTWIYLPDYRKLFKTACLSTEDYAPACRSHG